MSTQPHLSGLVPHALVGQGKYRLIRQLGRGGMGVVWEAEDRLRRGAACALKFVVVPLDPGVEEDVFPREAFVDLVHPHIVRVFECFRMNRHVQVVRMELLHGETLAGRLQRRPALEISEVAAIIGQVASALGTAHAHGVVHRDVKPSNLFLLERAKKAPHVKVLDFGIAKLINAPQLATVELTKEARSLGTPGYAAPEQLRNASSSGAAADIWSLGVVLFECMYGTVPFPNKSDIELWEASLTTPAILEAQGDYPPDVRAQLAGMLSHRPDLRPTLRDVIDRMAQHTDVDLGDIVEPASWVPGRATPADGDRRITEGAPRTETGRADSWIEPSSAASRDVGTQVPADCDALDVSAMKSGDARPIPDEARPVPPAAAGVRLEGRRRAARWALLPLLGTIGGITFTLVSSSARAPQTRDLGRAESTQRPGAPRAEDASATHPEATASATPDPAPPIATTTERPRSPPDPKPYPNGPWKRPSATSSAAASASAPKPSLTAGTNFE